METLSTVLLLLGAGLILWFTYRSIQRNPAAFSKDKLNKSFFTVGILALFLIAIIAVLVMLIRR